MYLTPAKLREEPINSLPAGVPALYGKAAAIALVLWLGFIAIGTVIATHHAGEPPFWDALSYAQKAKHFWDNVAAHKWVNPFNIEPAIRPPGSILISYPFGFSANWHRFYWRWTFIPIALLAFAPYLVGWARNQTASHQITLLSAALVLAGMPFLYQFQPNEILWSESYWGLVDGFLAGVDAIAMACIIVSVRSRSIGWAAAGAIIAAYGSFVKIQGLLSMGVIGVAWAALYLDQRRRWPKIDRDPVGMKYFGISLALGSAVYASAIGIGFWSSYYSPQSIAFYVRNIRIFHGELDYAITLKLLSRLLHCSCGWPILTVIAFGLISSFSIPRHRVAGACAVVSLTVGAWFWMSATNIGCVRYFMPFVTTSFILTLPAVLTVASHSRLWWTSSIAFLLTVPTLLVTVMLFFPSPFIPLERVLGVNLLTNRYPSEGKQAENLLEEVKLAEGGERQIYLFDLNGPSRNIGSVIDYHNLIYYEHLHATLPVDWQRGLAFRFDEIANASYLGFEPIHDPKARAAIIAQVPIDNFSDEIQLMRASATELGIDDGVAIISETRVRLLRVIDPVKLRAALRRIAAAHTWPSTFMAANDPKWWRP